jgi:hypothetical protein
MKKTFPKSELIALGLPLGGPAIVRDEIIDVTRWSVVHEVTFTLPGQVDGMGCFLQRRSYRVPG